MGSEKLKETKEVCILLLDLGKALDQAKANNGSIGVDDLGLLLPLVSSVGPAVKDVNLAMAEWKGASSEDRQALVAELSAQFSLADKQVEEKIEAGMTMLISLGKFLS